MSEIKLCERGFEVLTLCAFRYAVDRHCTQSMTRGAGDGDTIENIIMDNLDHINANFKCQMMQDITREIECYDNLESSGERWGSKTIKRGDHDYTYYTPHYLDRLLNALKEDYKKTHGGVEWEEWMQC